LVAVFRHSGSSPGDVAAVRAVVRAYVDTQRRLGARAERIVVDLEDAMRAAGVDGDNATPEERRFAGSVIEWGIEQYYGPPDEGQPPNARDAR